MDNKGRTQRSTHLGLFLILAFASMILFYGLGGRIQEYFNRSQGNDEILVYLYRIGPDKGDMYLYDPAKNTNTQIFKNYEISSFAFSSNRTIAFVAENELGKKDIYIAEYPFRKNSPTIITSDLEGNSFLYSWYSSWSPDGTYLAFHNTRPNSSRLLVWNEGRITTIHNHNYTVGETSWSNDNQLAFTDFISNDNTSDHDFSEIYLWDGSITRSISQNPKGEDRFPDWSADGQLAFLSDRNDEYGIHIWDGQSKINGVPDTDSYFDIAPELTFYMSIPTWTSDNTIIFRGLSTSFGSQIYEWDGSETIIEVDPINKIYADKPYAISNNGLVAYCLFENKGNAREWVLNLWDTNKVIEIARKGYISVIWENGESVHCSSG